LAWSMWPFPGGGAPPAPRDEFARDATRRAVERLRGGAR
jgi:hypothetical protein